MHRHPVLGRHELGVAIPHVRERQDGHRRRRFSEISASVFGSIRTLVEGLCIRCGELHMRVHQDGEGIRRRAMTLQLISSRWDLDANPMPTPAMWQVGAPLAWIATCTYAE